MRSEAREAGCRMPDTGYQLPEAGYRRSDAKPGKRPQAAALQTQARDAEVRSVAKRMECAGWPALRLAQAGRLAGAVERGRMPEARCPMPVTRCQIPDTGADGRWTLARLPAAAWRRPLVCRIAGCQPAGAPRPDRRGRLEVGDTAGWKPALRADGVPAVGSRRGRGRCPSQVGGRWPPEHGRAARGFGPGGRGGASSTA